MKKFMAGAVIIGSVFLISSCGDGSTADSQLSDSTKDAKEVAQDQNEQKFDSTAMKDDVDFAVKAADGGMLEVELGKLALQNAASPRVKDFGQMMVDDHSKANAQLKQTAMQKNITLPAAMSDKCQKMYADLSKKKGKDFDKAYMSAMVDDHKDDVDEFKKEADNGKDADLKSWAAGKVPVLQHHLDVAQNVKDSIK